MVSLEKIYNHIRAKYYKKTDSAFSLAITFSFFSIAIVFAVVFLIDLYILDRKMLLLYESTLGIDFNLRVLVIPGALLIIYYTIKFKEYNSRDTDNRVD